jgi:hypothetical protein
MLVLSETTDKIQIALGSTRITNDMDCFASWRDITASTYTPGRTASNSNGTSDADLVGSPVTSTQRVIDFISIFNNDTALQTTTIKLDANGTEKILWKGDIASGGRVEYQEGEGFTYTAPSPQGYAINVQALTSSPTDAQTVYFGMLPKAPATSAGISKVYIRKAGTIKIAEIYCYSGTAGTAEEWSLYIRKNNSADTLIASLSVAASERIFSNTSLSIAVSVGDYIEIKGVQPTWATNPLTTIYGGYIYIE